MDDNVKFYTCDSGDWVVVEAYSEGNTCRWEGHNISQWDIMEILNFFDIDTEEVELSDEEMENFGS